MPTSVDYKQLKRKLQNLHRWHNISVVCLATLTTADAIEEMNAAIMQLEFIIRQTENLLHEA